MAKQKKRTNKFWNFQFDRFVSYLKRRKISVSTKKTKRNNCFWYPHRREIIITNAFNPERQFYALLHEFGHSAIRDSFQENKEVASRKYQFLRCSNFCQYSQVGKIALLEHEIDAWNVGYQKAKEMGFYIDERKFEIEKASHIIAYSCHISYEKVRKGILKEINEELEKYDFDWEFY